ncbi:MAG: regulatory protein RecX [Rhodoluna sp.]|nr:regulatory protein RecX [Rhodoluna sp.]
MTEKAPSREKLESRARNVLLFQLSKGAKSKAQLRAILVKREIPEDIAEPILDRFEEAGLIDDQQFASVVVNSRRSHKGLSKSAIKRELNTKGVAPEIIDDALSEITSEQELETAQELAVKRLRALSHLDKDVQDRRLSGFLARKGYGGGIVYAAIRFAREQAVKSEV